MVEDGLAREVQDNGILTKLNRLTSNAARLVLYVLIRNGHEVVKLHPAGGSQALPLFCQIFRGTPEGERRCRACRSRVAAGACAQGLSEFECHGGISVVAAPAIHPDGTKSDRLVVASSLVARRSHDRGWRSTASYASGLGLDVRRLKRAYYTLPEFTDANVSTVTGIIDLAATILGDFEERWIRESGQKDAAPSWTSKHPDDSAFQSAPMVFTMDPSCRPVGVNRGSALVDLVIATVKRDPSMPHSVSSIARAARMTPNHFSALFHKQTGKTFREFLTEERIACSYGLLSNLRLSIGDVARRSGFEDPAYFSRRFRQITGLPPSEWRNRLRPSMD